MEKFSFRWNFFYPPYDHGYDVFFFSLEGGKVWLEHMTKWKWSSSFLCKKFHPSKVRKVILFTLVSFKFLLPLPLNPLSSLTQKSGNLQSEEVHLFASSGEARRVTLGWMGAKENPELRQWDTNCQRLKLLQKYIFHTVYSVNLNSHVLLSCVCPYVSICTIGVTHQTNMLLWCPRAFPRQICPYFIIWDNPALVLVCRKSTII